ncbi:MAG: DUF192 domain-containing protein [Bdellovibrionales bacterium]
MTKLLRKRDNQLLVPELEVAKSLFSIAKGLLGRRELASDRGLWIWSGGSIHTFFMQFAIDLVFLDEQMVVTKIYQSVPPWRILPPARKAVSVVELAGGFLEKCPIQVGDELYVDPALS